MPFDYYIFNKIWSKFNTSKYSNFFYSETINLGRYGIFFTLFCFLVFLNAFNMFDGINLQSCLYSLIIFLNLFNYSNLSLLLLIIIIVLLVFIFEF